MLRKTIASAAALAVALTGGFATAATAAGEPVVERVLFSSIAPNSDNYDQWHQGQWDRQNLDGVSVSADGLHLDGKNQIIKGVDNVDSLTELVDSLDIEATVEVGTAWYQIPLYWGPQREDLPGDQADFTTLRKNVESDVDEWTTSRNIRNADDEVLLAAHLSRPIAEIVAILETAAESHSSAVKIDAYGFSSADVNSQTPAEATVATFTAAGTTYDFRKVEAPGSVAINGDAVVGSTLTANSAVVASTTVAYQWFSGETTIAGATGGTLSLTPELLNATITVQAAYSSNDYFPVTVTSAPVTVAAGTLAAPTVTVKGKPNVGKKLTAQPTWQQAPETVTYQWFAGKKAIAGATSATYTVTTDVVGKRLSVQVTGTSAGYTAAAATSDKTAKVKKLEVKLNAKVMKKPAKGDVRRVKVTVKVGKAPVVAGKITLKNGKRTVTRKIKKNAKNVVKIKVWAGKKVTVTYTPNKATGKYTKNAKTVLKKKQVR